MVRAQIGLVLAGVAGVFLLGTNLRAEPKLAGAASGTTSDALDGQDLSTQEMQQRADIMLSTLNENLEHASSAQSRAKKTRDVIKVNCVNDGLLVTKTVVNMGESAKAKFDKAVQANDRSEQHAQFGKIVAAVNDCNQSKNSIDSCVGGNDISTTTVNGQRVTVSHPNVRDNPTHDCNTLGLASCGGQLEYVAYASPFTPD